MASKMHTYTFWYSWGLYDGQDGRCGDEDVTAKNLADAFAKFEEIVTWKVTIDGIDIDGEPIDESTLERYYHDREEEEEAQRERWAELNAERIYDD